MTPDGDSQIIWDLVIGVLLVIPYAACICALLDSRKDGEYWTTIRNYFRRLAHHLDEIMPMTIVIYFAHMILGFFGL